MSIKQNKLTRAFISIDFPSEVIKEVARIQSVLNTRANFTGKITELENLHITLKFLGHISKSQLQQVKKLLSTISFPVLNLSLNSCGTFNFRSNPKIIWIKVTGNIHQLQKEIDQVLKPLFKPESRFMSHLTIARIKQMGAMINDTFFMVFILSVMDWLPGAPASQFLLSLYPSLQ